MRTLLAGTLLGLVLSAAGAAHLELSLGALLGLRPELAALGAVALLAALWRPSSEGRGPWWPALLMGLGIGISGLLPVTAAVGLGEGHLVAGVLLVGIYGGRALHDRLRGPPSDADYSQDECNQG